MLSKSRGQVLRVAAVLHMLFSIDNDNYEVKEEVSQDAIKAAINLIKTACQQTAFVAGRGVLQEEVVNPTLKGLFTYKSSFTSTHIQCTTTILFQATAVQ